MEPTAQLLAAHGHDAVQVDEPHPFDEADLVLLIGSALWYRHTCRELVRTPPERRPLVAIWHREPLPPARAAGLRRPLPDPLELFDVARRDRRATGENGNAWLLRRLARHGLPHVLVASTRGRQEYLLERGLDAHWAPLGHNPVHHGRGDLGLERDIDVLFLGALDVRRRRRKLRELRRHGVHVVAKGSWSDPSCWGEGRLRLLNRARILLNISRHPGNLADDRFLLGMANGALVISEPVYRPEPFVPGRHFLEAEIDAMPALIEHYLAHEDERRAIAAEARRFVLEEHTIEAAVGTMLEHVSKIAWGDPPAFA